MDSSHDPFPLIVSPSGLNPEKTMRLGQINHIYFSEFGRPHLFGWRSLWKNFSFQRAPHTSLPFCWSQGDRPDGRR